MWSYVAQVASLLSFASWHAASLCIFSTKDLLLKLVVGTPKAENENETRNGEDEGEPPAVVFYEGHVVHSRAKPVKNAFKYEIRLALINLDKPPAWWQADSGKRQLALAPELVRRECNTKGPVLLLTIPSCCGYAQNPISVYYAYEDKACSKLKQCIAEVTNTPWAEKVVFSFDPHMKEPLPKSLHVSPFMDMSNTWKISTDSPSIERGLRVDISVNHPEYGAYFVASLRARASKHSFLRSEAADWTTLLKYGYMPHRVAMWIYWQAVVLLCKGVPFHMHPSLETYRGRVTQELEKKQKGTRFLTWDWSNVHWPWNRS